MLVHLAQLLVVSGRHGVDVRLQGVDELGVELRHERKVRLFLIGAVEDVPRQVVNVPGVEEVDVGESQRDGSLGLGEGCDVEVGA